MVETLFVLDEFLCVREYKNIPTSCCSFSKHARCTVFLGMYFPLLDSLLYFLRHKDVLSAEITTQLVHTLQKRPGNSAWQEQRGFCSYESPSVTAFPLNT